MVTASCTSMTSPAKRASRDGFAVFPNKKQADRLLAAGEKVLFELRLRHRRQGRPGRIISSANCQVSPANNIGSRNPAKEVQPTGTNAGSGLGPRTCSPVLFRDSHIGYGRSDRRK